MDIFCKKNRYYCSYNSWNKLREVIMHASIQFLNEKIKIHKSNNLIITQLNNFIKDNNCETVHDFSSMFQLNNNFTNIYIEYHIGGVHVLLNKNDDAYFSIGNSLDIIQALHILLPYINDQEIITRINVIKKIFQESIELNINVTLF
jgi:hypothetical protein